MTPAGKRKASSTQTATFKLQATAAEFALWEKLTEDNAAAAASGAQPKGKGKRPAPTTNAILAVFLEGFRDSVLSKAREHCVVVEASQTDAERAKRWCTDMLRVKKEVDEAAERVKRLRATVPSAAAARVRGFLAAELSQVDADAYAATALPDPEAAIEGSGSKSTRRGSAADGEAKSGMDPKELLPLLKDLQKTLRSLPKPLKAADKRAQELQKGLESNIKAVKGSLASGMSATEVMLSKAPPVRQAAEAGAPRGDTTEEESSAAEAAAGPARSSAAAGGKGASASGGSSGVSVEEARIAVTKRVRKEAAAAPMGRFLQRMR